MPRLTRKFNLLYPYTQPSPAAKLKTVPEPLPGNFNVQAKYNYNYYVQDELTVPADSEAVDDPRGLPRSVTIEAGVIDAMSAMQIDDVYGVKGERSMESRSLTDEERRQIVSVTNELRDRLGGSTTAITNFEEFSRGDFLGVSDAGSNIAATMQSNLSLQNTSAGPSPTIRYENLEETSILRAAATPGFADSFGDRFESSTFKIIPDVAGDFEFEGLFSGQSGKSYDVGRAAIPSVLLQALTNNPFSSDQRELTRSAGSIDPDSFVETVSNLRGFLAEGGEVTIPPSLTTLVDSSTIIRDEGTDRLFSKLVDIAGFSSPTDISDGELGSGIVSRTTYCPIGCIVRRVDLGSVGGIIDRDGNTVRPGSSATTPAYIGGGTLPIKGDSGEFIDGGVIAGHRYVYEVRRVHVMVRSYLSEFVMEDIDRDGYEGLTSRTEVFLLAGRPKSVQVTTMPQPQAGRDTSIVPQFFIVDKQETPTAEKDLIVSWNNPEVTNGGAPIRSFLLFRRGSVLEPFTLISVHKALDVADDRRIRVPQTYTLAQGRIPNRYLDEGFGRDTSYIYAVAATDIYGRLTGLSMQFRVRYNPGLYALEIDEVSPEGAPLQFPNLFINTKNGGVSRSIGSTDFTTELSDSIMRVSGADRVRVFPSAGRSSYGFEEGQPEVGEVLTRAIDSDGSMTEARVPLVRVDTAAKENLYVLNIISLNDEKSTNLTLRFT